MKTATIRQKFVDFFNQKNHTLIPAVPIVQQDNPALLFVNAGMNPFANVLLGHEAAPTLRATNSQPCLRVTGKHNDLEEVGVDTYHHTLFEMLGSWSFGDYFKQDAMAYAWELLTEVYQLPKDRLYVTVFEGDQADGLQPDAETLQHWQAYLPADRILYGSKKDNFWEMGATGPCGPCTEIHVDMRSEAARQEVAGHTLVNADHPQVVELWNLVFIQYHRQANGGLVPLPTCHVDTGMGLERLAMVLQGKQATYDTDAFQPLLQAVGEMAGTVYGRSEAQDIALRVAADHVRAITLAIASGAVPSNQQAGYVVRRLLRRAVRYGYQHLGLQTPFLHTLVPQVVAGMEVVYPWLAKQPALIQKVVYEEEKGFLATLAQGLRQFQHFRTHADGDVLDGQAAFQLYDTYGFPVDLTRLMAQEEGMSVDMEGFAKAMAVQKNRSKRAAAKAYGDWHRVEGRDLATTFVGYDHLETESQLVAYRTLTKQGKTLYQLMLDRTPFYPQGGGQVGDTGVVSMGGEEIAVVDTKREEGLVVHYTDALPKVLDAPVKAVVDASRRQLIAHNHTATHLLEAALRQVLGPHVAQRGSYLDDERLRFDFSHPEKLTQDQCDAIETLVNAKIRANIPCLEERDVPLEEARGRGAITLVGESYGAQVRVITFDPNYSVALCGGTHVPATGHIGFFKIVAETSVGAGIRRLEAMTAVAAEQWVRRTHAKLSTVQGLLKNPQDTVQALQALQKAYKKEQKALAAYQQQAVRDAQASLQAKIQRCGEIHVGIASLVVPSVQDLRKVMMSLGRAHAPLVLVVTTTIEGQAYVAASVSKDLVHQYDAGKIVRVLAPCIQGEGGGPPAFAVAKGNHLAGLDAVQVQAREIVGLPSL